MSTPGVSRPLSTVPPPGTDLSTWLLPNMGSDGDLSGAAASLGGDQDTNSPLDDTAAAMQAAAQTFMPDQHNAKDATESLAQQGAQEAATDGAERLAATEGASRVGSTIASTAGRVASAVGERVIGAAATEAIAGGAEAAIGATVGATEAACAAAGPIGWVAGGLLAGALAIGTIFEAIFGHKDFQADIEGATKSHTEDSDKIDTSMQAVQTDQSNMTEDQASNNDSQLKTDTKQLGKDEKALAQHQKSERGDNQRAYVDANKEEDDIRKQMINVQTDIDQHPDDAKRLAKDKKNLQDQETKILSKAGSDPNAKALAQRAINAGLKDVAIAHANGTPLGKSQNNFYTNETHGMGNKSGDLDPYSASLGDLAENSATLAKQSGGGYDSSAIVAAMRQLETDYPDEVATNDPSAAAAREGVAVAVANAPVNAPTGSTASNT